MDVMNCCRTCLSTDNLNPIFKIHKENKQYSTLLRIATGLKIEMHDTLSQSMCSKCINFINKTIEFRQQCYKTQIKLKNLMKYKWCNNTLRNNSNNDKVHDNDNINMTNLNVDTNNEKQTIKMKHKTNDIFDDDSSNYNDTMSVNSFIDTNNKLQFNEIRNINPLFDTNKLNQEIQSENCKEFETTVEQALKQQIDMKFSNYVPRKKVKLQYEENVVIKEEMEDVKDLRNPLQCKYCFKVMKSKSSLNSHYSIHKGRKIICEHCGMKFLNKRRLLMHCRGKHGYEKTDKCAYCDYKGSNAEQVKIHERIHTGERPYVCSSCGATFCRKSSYLQHVAIHLPEKTVPCPECPAWFKSATLMRVHRDRHRRRRKLRVNDI